MQCVKNSIFRVNSVAIVVFGFWFRFLLHHGGIVVVVVCLFREGMEWNGMKWTGEKNKCIYRLCTQKRNIHRKWPNVNKMLSKYFTNYNHIKYANFNQCDKLSSQSWGQQRSKTIQVLVSLSETFVWFGYKLESTERKKNIKNGTNLNLNHVSWSSEFLVHF